MRAVRMGSNPASRAIRLRPWPDNPEKARAENLARYLGWFGAHWFYLRRPWIGTLYLLFAWTFVPLVLGAVDGARLAVMSAEEFERRYAPRRPPDPPTIEPPAAR